MSTSVRDNNISGKSNFTISLPPKVDNNKKYYKDEIIDRWTKYKCFTDIILQDVTLGRHETKRDHVLKKFDDYIKSGSLNIQEHERETDNIEQVLARNKEIETQKIKIKRLKLAAQAVEFSKGHYKPQNNLLEVLGLSEQLEPIERKIEKYTLVYVWGNQLERAELDIFGFDYEKEYRESIKPDWSYWAEIPVVSLRDAVFLSMNISPSINPADINQADTLKIFKSLEVAFKNLEPKGGELEPYDYWDDEGSIYTARTNAEDPMEKYNFNKVKTKIFAEWAESAPRCWDLPEEFPKKPSTKNIKTTTQETHSTKWLNVLNASIQEFYIPRRKNDPKGEGEVIPWIIERAKKEGITVSPNTTAKAIFTIIKPDDHNPRKKID